MPSWVPFPSMTLVALVLFFAGEQFPFSNFPMFSNVGDYAEVLYVTDQTDEPLSMLRCFRTSSASAKKVFRTELGKLTHKRRRGAQQATGAERAAAAQTVLDLLLQRIDRLALPPGSTALRVHVRTFRRSRSGVAELPPERLAESPL